MASPPPSKLRRLSVVAALVLGLILFVAASLASAALPSFALLKEFTSVDSVATPPRVLDTPLGRAGAASAFSSPRTRWGPPGDGPPVDCAELFAAVDAPHDGSNTLGCDPARPAFPAYYACVLAGVAEGTLPGGAATHISGAYGLGNQLRTAVGTFLYALASRRTFSSSNSYLMAHFRPPQLPRLAGQSVAEKSDVDDRSWTAVCNGTRPKSADGAVLACRSSARMPRIEACRPDEKGSCVRLERGDLRTAAVEEDVLMSVTYDYAPWILSNPTTGLAMRRLFCTASPIRVQAAAMSWLLSRPHPELALAAAALARKLGFPYPRPSTVMHGLSVNESAAVLAVRDGPGLLSGGGVVTAARVSTDEANFSGAAAGQCGVSLPLVGVQVRALQAPMVGGTEAAMLACTIEAVGVLSRRLAAGGNAALGPLLMYTDATSPAASGAPSLSQQQQQRACFWITADSNTTWSPLRAALSPLGPVLIHTDAQPGHTSERKYTIPDLPRLLHLPRSQYLDSLSMDIVDFYLLGEVDHMVKADGSSFGEYGFLRGGLRRGASFLKYIMPGRDRNVRGCFLPLSVDAGWTNFTPQAGRQQEMMLEEGLAVPRDGDGGVDWSMVGTVAARDR